MKAYFIHILSLALVVLTIVGFIVINTLTTANSYKEQRNVFESVEACILQEST